MDMNEELELLKGMTEDQMRAYLRGKSPTQLLDLALLAAEHLRQQVERIPELILEGMEQDLPNHTASEQEARRLLERLTGSAR